MSVGVAFPENIRVTEVPQRTTALDCEATFSCLSHSHIEYEMILVVTFGRLFHICPYAKKLYMNCKQIGTFTVSKGMW